MNMSGIFVQNINECLQTVGDLLQKTYCGRLIQLNSKEENV